MHNQSFREQDKHRIHGIWAAGDSEQLAQIPNIQSESYRTPDFARQKSRGWGGMLVWKNMTLTQWGMARENPASTWTYEGREGAIATKDAKFMSMCFIPYKGEEGREEDSVVFWTIRSLAKPLGSLPSYNAKSGGITFFCWKKKKWELKILLPHCTCKCSSEQETA